MPTLSDHLASHGPHMTASAMRAVNRAAVTATVRRKGSVTRAALCAETGLSKGAVSSLVAELIRDGVLCEDGAEGGRRNRVLRLNDAVGVALGVEMGTLMCRGIATDIAITPLQHVVRPVTSTSVESTISLIASMARELLAGESRPCLGLTVAVPGPTDAEGHLVVFSESLGWSDVPLAGRLTDALGYPVRVINRPRAGAIGEHWYGAGRGVDNMIYVSVSDGIAAAIYIDGRLFAGAQGFGGEFGHTTMLIDGPPCVCGNRGCLETVASLPAIREAIRARMRRGETTSLTEPITYQAIIAAARDGDALALEEVRSASEFVGIGVANLIDIFNPSLVIVGGYLAEAGEVVLNAVRRTAQRRTFPLTYRSVQIQRNALSLDSACVGACAQVVNEYVARMEPALAGDTWF